MVIIAVIYATIKMSRSILYSCRYLYCNYDTAILVVDALVALGGKLAKL